MLTYLSAALLKVGDAEGARKVLQDTRDKNIANFRMHYTLALAYRALHQEVEAMASLERAAFGPDAIRFLKTIHYRSAASLLTKYYFRKGRFRDMMKMGQQAVELSDRLKQEAKLAVIDQL